MATTYGVLRRCPGCSSQRLLPVATIDGRNFFCRDCDSCWHLEHGVTTPVNPDTCPGCQLGVTACAERRGMISRNRRLYGPVRLAPCFAFSE